MHPESYGTIEPHETLKGWRYKEEFNWMMKRIQ